MARIAITCFVALLAAGCSGDRGATPSGAADPPAAETTAPAAETTAPAAEPSKPVEPAAPAAPAAAVPDRPAPRAVDNAPAPEEDVQQSCVADCVARNQMRAVSPEQIERDCRDECAAGDDL